MDKNLNQPLVSVLMPVYNSEDYLGLAIESILNQTYTNFEFLIINDCSTDNSLEIILAYKDSRIKVFNNKQNSGISETLNWGLQQAKGKYIVRMDSDDSSFSNRIEKQVEFLEKNTEYILCGSNYSIMDSTYKVELPEKHDAIKTVLLESCCIAHPTAVFKKEVLENNNLLYIKEQEPAEDYHLWCRLIKKGKFYNLQENLLEYRVHKKQISQSNKNEQDRKSFLIKINYIKSFYKELSEKETHILKRMFLIKDKINYTDSEVFSAFVKGMKEKNNKIIFFDSKCFEIYIYNLENIFLTKYFAKNERYFFLDFITYLKILIKYNLKLDKKNAFKLFIKSLFCYKIKSRSL